MNLPTLKAPLTHPLQHAQARIAQQQDTITAWFAQQWEKTPAPFYCSVDLRHAGFKIAPIDTNLFPAGCNNLTKDAQQHCINAVQHILHSSTQPHAKKLLLIPEDHTRNPHYFEHLTALHHILTHAGYDVRLGSLTHTTPYTPPTLPQEMTLHPITRKGATLSVADFTPDWILLNNDLSSGVPELLCDIAQPILPPLHLGWTARLKSHHFARYQHIARTFSALLDQDPWLITPLFRNCGKINFMKRAGEDCLVHNAHLLLKAIQEKYTEYNIDQKPFIIVKADAGTYGMAVMTVHDPESLRTLNRKKRTRMASVKGGLSVEDVILQEGVYSFETWGGAESSVAEPVCYMMGAQTVGGFYRIHADKGTNESLNAPGMHFQPIAFPTAPHPEAARFYLYQVIAQLALVAAAQEYALHSLHPTPAGTTS